MELLTPLFNNFWFAIALVSVVALASTLHVLFKIRQVNVHVAGRLKKLDQSMAVLTTGALGMGQKMLRLEVEIKHLQQNQEELGQADIEFSYTQAQKLISQGFDDGAVAANSGLSATEINLMRMLQQQSDKNTRYHA